MKELDEEEEGVAKPLSKTQITKTTRVSRTCFWCEPKDVDEEMEDIEEIDGTSAQLETSK